MKNLLNKLEGLKNVSGLYNAVVVEVLDTYAENEDIKVWFEDLLTHGCASGMIGSLIYYSDTHKFYDTHYSEIEDMRCEYERDLGISLDIDENDLKNWFAWFAFEETARRVASDIGLEI